MLGLELFALNDARWNSVQSSRAGIRLADFGAGFVLGGIRVRCQGDTRDYVNCGSDRRKPLKLSSSRMFSLW